MLNMDTGVDDEEQIHILSPIHRSDFWDQDKLLATIRQLNADPEVRDMIELFRNERREVLSEEAVDLTTLRSCCQILLDELDELIKNKLKKDWEKYQRALQFFNECMSDADYESLTEEAIKELDMPSWLGNTWA